MFGALLLLAAITLINLRGIAESVKLNVGFTLVEIGGLLLIVVIAVVALGQGDADAGRAFEFKEGSSVFAAMLAGAALAFYALVGFEDSVNVAEETKDPTRVYPKALFGGLAIAGVLYFLVTVGASAVVPTDDLANSSGPLLEVVKQGALGIPEKVFSAIGLLLTRSDPSRRPCGGQRTGAEQVFGGGVAERGCGDAGGPRSAHGAARPREWAGDRQVARAAQRAARQDELAESGRADGEGECAAGHLQASRPGEAVDGVRAGGVHDLHTSSEVGDADVVARRGEGVAAPVDQRAPSGGAGAAVPLDGSRAAFIRMSGRSQRESREQASR